MSEKFSRADRLYILAKALSDKHLTPDSPTYAGFIIGVSAANFYRDKTAALEDAETLTSAYKTDKWHSIIYGAIGTDGTIEAAAHTHSKVTPQTPTLNALKTFTLKTPCVPVKTVPPKHVAESETAPYTQAMQLLRIAEGDMFNGVGRLSLAQARDALDDRSLKVEDVLSFLRCNIRDVVFEPRPHNMIYCYLNGKNTVQANRSRRVIIPELPPQLSAPKEYYTEPPLETTDMKGERVTY